MNNTGANQTDIPQADLHLSWCPMALINHITLRMVEYTIWPFGVHFNGLWLFD